MEIVQQLVLCPLIGSGDAEQSRVLRFKAENPAGSDLVHKTAAGAGDVVSVLTPGIYSVSAAMRFQCMVGEDPSPFPNAWGITLNSFRQSQRNVVDYPTAHVLAKAHLSEPSERDRQLEPMTTLSWVGFLGPGDELRVESGREKPRLYQGIAEDRCCFLRITKLLDLKIAVDTTVLGR